VEKARPSENFGKLRAIRDETADVIGDVVEARASLQEKAERPAPRQQLRAVAEPARLGNEHRAGAELAAGRRDLKGVEPKRTLLPDRTVGIGRAAQTRPAAAAGQATREVRRGGLGHRCGWVGPQARA
jgi:hypothetical protein